MTNQFTAIASGIVIGIVLCAPLNAGLNKLETAECREHGDSHTLVSTRQFFGETKMCINNRYL